MLDVVLIVKLNFGPDAGYRISMLFGFYLMGNNQAFREIMLQQYTVEYYMSIPMYNWSQCEAGFTEKIRGSVI